MGFAADPQIRGEIDRAVLVTANLGRIGGPIVDMFGELIADIHFRFSIIGRQHRAMEKD